MNTQLPCLEYSCFQKSVLVSRSEYQYLFKSGRIGTNLFTENWTFLQNEGKSVFEFCGQIRELRIPLPDIDYFL